MRFGVSVKLISLSCLFFLSSCSVMEMSGKMTRKTGEVMEEYGTENDGFIGSMVGFGGRMNTSVGSTVEDMAKDDEIDLGKTRTEQFIEANKSVTNAALDSMDTEDITKETIIKAQERLKEHGYYSGSTDGTIGEKTEAAIAQYQVKNGLKVTKVLDNETLISLGVE